MKAFENILNFQFISFSEETVFETSLLDNFTSQLLHNHATFTGFTEAYNHFHRTKLSYIEEKSRFVLKDQRLAEIWFCYRMLLIYFEINMSFNNFEFFDIQNLDKNIDILLKLLPTYFVNKWAGIYFLKFIKRFKFFWGI